MKQRTIFSILYTSFFILIILTIGEYRSLLNDIQRIRILQNHYYGYLDIVKRIVRMQRVPPSIAEQKTVLVNRTSPYVKKTSIPHPDKQKHKKLLRRPDEENACTEQDGHVSDLQSNSMSESEAASYQEDQRMVPQWAHAPRRKSSTGVTFMCPLGRSCFWLSSLFGARKKPNGQVGFHYGIDMAAQRGTEVYAAAAGTVEYAGYAPGYGNTIVIIHDTIYKTRYAHLDEIRVGKKKRIRQGTIIGVVGDTGFTIKQGHDGSHLHFELYEHGKQVNPLSFIEV